MAPALNFETNIIWILVWNGDGEIPESIYRAILLHHDILNMALPMVLILVIAI